VAKQGMLIDVRGLKQVDRALRQVAPDLRREFYRDLGHTIKARVTVAKAESPFKRKRKGATGGHLRTLTYLTKAGAKRDISGGRKQGLFGFTAISAAPHASILDLAAQGHSKQGQTLVATLNARYGPAPRFLGKQLLPKAGAGLDLYRESQGIVAKYVAELNRIIDSAATSRIVS
jgi:hypothetical protein